MSESGNVDDDEHEDGQVVDVFLYFSKAFFPDIGPAVAICDCGTGCESVDDRGANHYDVPVCSCVGSTFLAFPHSCINPVDSIACVFPHYCYKDGESCGVECIDKEVEKLEPNWSSMSVLGRWLLHFL